MKRFFVPAFALCAGACAYYNGIYNAKSFASTADKQAMKGESFAASQTYLMSATKAETVLVRYPKTRWRNDALYFSARGYALGAECVHGLRRLDEYLAVPGQPASRRDRATIARAACMVTGNQLLSADSLLQPLLDNADPEIGGQAALWDGRAWLRLGDAARAEKLLARVPGAAAAWEFMDAAFQRGSYARAESLLVARAEVGDWLSSVPRYVRELWAVGDRKTVATVVDLYGKSRVPTDERVRLRFLLSDLAAAAGDTALARDEAIEAQRIGLSPTVDADARARLLTLRIREFDALADVENAIARDSAHARGTTTLQRLRDNVTIMRLLIGNPDTYGAHLFLAAEIARDSLQAYRLAHAMFRTIERDFGDYEIAARGLYAARMMFPESTSVYDARIVQKWDSSSAAFALLGLDPLASRKRAEDAALDRAWRVAMNQWNDTLKARKTIDSLNALQGIRR